MDYICFHLESNIFEHFLGRQISTRKSQRQCSSFIRIQQLSLFHAVQNSK